MQIRHYDFGAFVIAREILKQFPAARLEIEIAPVYNFYLDYPLIRDAFFRENNTLGVSSQQEKKHRKKQEYGIFLERKKTIQSHPNIKFFPYQVLPTLVQEGLADSVEFRRLARKFIRPAKHAHIRTLCCPELLFSAEKTPKILQHLAGTQMQIITIADILDGKIEKYFPGISPSKSREITIKIDKNIESDLTFAQSRAEKIIRTKIKKDQIGFLEGKNFAPISK